MFVQIASLLVAGALAIPQTPGSPPPRQNPPEQGGQGRTPQQPGSRAEQARKNQRLNLQRSDKVLGMSVQDRNRSNIAVIDDMILTPNGEIVYGVLSGKEGSGQSKLYAIPWSTLHMDMVGEPGQSKAPDGPGDPSMRSNAASLDIERDRLFSGPGFERTSWTKTLDDSKYYSQVDDYYKSSMTNLDGQGRPLEAGARIGAGTFRGSLLRNQAVVDAQGKKIGTISQVAFDPAGSRISYVALTLDDASGGGARTVAVPWEALRVGRAQTDPATGARSGNMSLTLDVSAEKLRSAPEFQTGESSWKQMSDPKWVEDLYGYFGKRPYWNTRNDGRTDGMDGKPKDMGGQKPSPNEPR